MAKDLAQAEKDFDVTADCKSSKAAIAGGCQPKNEKVCFLFLSIDKEDKEEEKFARGCGMPATGYSAEGVVGGGWVWASFAGRE